MSTSIEETSYQQPVFQDEGYMRELNARRDSFGNQVVLLWNPADNTVHINVGGIDVEVPADKAKESYEDHLPVLAKQLGWKAVEAFTAEAA